MTTLDIGGDVRLEQADAVALLDRQTQLLEQIAAGAPLSVVLAGIASTLESLVPDCACSVLLLSPETGILRHGAAPSLPAAYSAEIDGMSIGPAAGSCGTAAFTGLPVVVTDILTDPRWDDFRSLASRFELRACWSTPIRGRGGVCGTFAVYHSRPHSPSVREEHLVERLTHLASVAIDHAGVVGALAESEERFRRAFDDNAVGMALVSCDGAITRVNGAMRSLLGRDPSGSSLDSVFRHAADVDLDFYEATATARDGRTLDVSVTVSTIRSASGAAHALSVSVLDLTGRRAAERERHRRVEAEIARTAAESASRAKTDFVAALGHELRTPLQAITGFTELLGGASLSANRRAEALDHISAAVDHILCMVGDVLDVARIEARALPLALRPVSVGPVVDEVLAMVQPLASAERVTLHSSSSSEVCVVADERRLRQVLLNLVSNAIRYNRVDGSVWVDWTVADSQVRITVRDTGPGIANEDLGRLFTPFDRLDRSSDQGIGLGLPLARGLTEAMHGSLDVHTEPQAGTTMELRFSPVS